MKRRQCIAIPDFTHCSRNEALVALCMHSMQLTQRELASRLQCTVVSLRTLKLTLEQQRRLCAMAAAQLTLRDSDVETWQPNGRRAEDATVRVAIMDKFRDVNPLLTIRRRCGVGTAEFATVCGVSRQRLHVLERAVGGRALERAVARAEAVYGS